MAYACRYEIPEPENTEMITILWTHKMAYACRYEIPEPENTEMI
ncbi:hypothetical protein QZH41_014121, partial [Actinostola sp. cb2023]